MSESEAPEPDSPADSEEAEKNAQLRGLWDATEKE
jgi:small subunit ribosomal protein S7